MRRSPAHESGDRSCRSRQGGIEWDGGPPWRSTTSCGHPGGSHGRVTLLAAVRGMQRVTACRCWTGHRPRSWRRFQALDIEETPLELPDGVVSDAWSSGTMYRGFEKILVGRGSLDGLVITPRVCGLCSTSHLTAAARDPGRDGGRPPCPPDAVRIRNIALAAEHVQNDVRQSFLMFAVDFVNPAYQVSPLYEEAIQRYAPFCGGRQRRQEPVPREHEPRAADAAQRHHRLQRDAPGRGGRPADGSVRHGPGEDPRRRQAPAGGSGRACNWGGQVAHRSPC